MSSQTELQYLTPHTAISAPPLRGPYSTAESGTGTGTGVHDSHDESQEFPSLPPVDGGRQAWLFLAACFAIEMLVWGFPFAFGVFQNHYSTNPPFAGQPNIAVIGTCAMGIMYLSGPVVIGLLRLFPRESRHAPILGLIVMCVALAASSFSRTVTHLIVTQGVFYGIGGAVAYCPCILYIDEWFVRRKGFAYGIMWSGTGLAGVVLPLLMEYLLGHVGFRTTLRLWSGLLFALTAPLAFFIKPRLPVSQATHARPFSNLRFMLCRPFALYQVASIVEAMGFFLPGIYLPSYAHAGATAGTFLAWGFSSNLGVLYVFCVVYGLFAGAYTSAWPGIMKAVVEHERERERGVDPSMVFGMLAAGRGVGNVISGPLSEALIKGAPWKGEAGFGYGSGYGTLIVFTGVTALMGGASFAWKRIG
ncbi:major facilitator superfamily transporter [Colletotrichum navitas]|uniref:Major facilitator superfamily transporter n=1 Tax=Colletotrichum navitas TaxID=681940 RepID=A0AAD8V8F1_9PEZI|nr:major facilitator superfamily transporter [Colletotrichum navitas]KAK1595385.1 major facilitator superfamily transporter [Colletotrichum navitas]